eukprot:Hpha_TRINITY_DN7535_c0_g1::TRINITY_DN7535_c0_g1_i1::g.18785::m.18785
MAEVRKRRLRKKRSDIKRKSAGSSSSGDESAAGEPSGAGTAGTDMFERVTSRILQGGEGQEGGFFAEYSLAEKKAEEKAKRRLERKKLKRKRAFEVEGGAQEASESSASEQSEDEAAKRRRLEDRRILRSHVLNQSHRREVAHLTQPDYEKRLRRVATKGVVRLFNAVTVAQQQAAEREKAEEGGTADGPKPKDPIPVREEVTKSKFLEMLKRGAHAAAEAQKAEEHAQASGKKKGPPKGKRKRK